MADDVLIVEDDTVVMEAPADVVLVDEAQVLVVTQDDPDVLLLDDDQVLLLTAPGPQGPPGPVGPPGGSYYVHTQTTPSSSWVVNHNLGLLGHVTVFVPDFVEVEADVVHNTVNQVAITFASPQAGTAFIS